MSFRPSLPKMASTVARSELTEQFIVALPGASALRFFPPITCPLFSLRQRAFGLRRYAQISEARYSSSAGQRAFGFFRQRCSEPRANICDSPGSSLLLIAGRRAWGTCGRLGLGPIVSAANVARMEVLP